MTVLLFLPSLTGSSVVDQPPVPKSPSHEPVVELPTQQIPSPVEPTEDVMDVDVEPSPQPHTQTEAQQSPLLQGGMSDTGLPVQSIQESVDSRGNRIVIIEELDTPATRRERTRRVKAERARLAAEAGGHMADVPEASGSGELEPAAPPTPGGQPGQDESDLSSLSAESDEAGGGEGVRTSTSVGRGRGRGRGKAGRPKSPGLGNISLPPDERLESGTLGIFQVFLHLGLFLTESLVWAKYLSYPWWSAVVYDDDLPEIPKNVLQRTHNETDYLVRFYDKSDLWYVVHISTWNGLISANCFRAWVPPEMLKLLGEIDGEMRLSTRLSR